MTVEISNIGPIEKIKIPVPEGGGIVVFRGRNGAGKTLALAAIDAAVTGKGKVPVRDGELRGEVQAHGVTMRIGRSTRREGFAEVHSLEGKMSIAGLVDPGIKDPESADAVRIKALVGLLGPPADLKVFGDLPDIELTPATRDATDLVDMASRIKRDLESAARHAEAASENARRDADAAKAAMGDDDPAWAQPEEEVLQALSDAYERRADLQGRRQAALDTSKRVVASKQTLDDATAGSSDGSPEALPTYDEAQAAFSDAAASLRVAEARWDLARSLKKLTDLWQKDLDAAQQVAATAVSDADLESADCAAVSARDACDQARRGRDAVAHTDLVAKHDERRQAKEDEATALRDGARAVDDVLSGIIQSAGIDLSVKVTDGRVRLVTETERGVTCFGQLSPGERWRMALDIAAEALGEGGELTIPQEAWEGLDDANRAAIAAHVQQLGIVAYTAESDAGPLRAEEL